LAEKFLFDGVETTLGAGDDDEGGVVGNAAVLGEVEGVDGEVAGGKFGTERGEAAVWADVVEGHLAVAGEEVDFFLGRAGDVEDGGGEGLFAAEGFFLLVSEGVEFVEADGAAAVAAED